MKATKKKNIFFSYIASLTFRRTNTCIYPSSYPSMGRFVLVLLHFPTPVVVVFPLSFFSLNCTPMSFFQPAWMDCKQASQTMRAPSVKKACCKFVFIFVYVFLCAWDSKYLFLSGWYWVRGKTYLHIHYLVL